MTKQDFTTYEPPDLSKQDKSSFELPRFIDPHVNKKIEEFERLYRDLQQQKKLLARDIEKYEQGIAPPWLREKTKLQFKKKADPNFKQQHEKEV